MERPFEKVEMVILGPFPVSTVGKKNIIAEVNYLVKWAKTRVTQSATTGCDAAKFSSKTLCCDMGRRKFDKRSWEVFYSRFYKGSCASNGNGS